MSPSGCPKMWVKPCNRNAEESFPVLSLKSREQKPPNPLLIQDKNVLQPSPKVTTSLGQRCASGCLGMARNCSSTSIEQCGDKLHSHHTALLSSQGCHASQRGRVVGRLQAQKTCPISL